MRRFCFNVLIVVALLFSITSVALAEAERQADHDALRGLLKVTQQAFNTANFELMKPHIARDHFTVVTVDGGKFETLDAFRNYWNDILKNNKTGLQRIEVNPVADGPTEFLSETVGICHGTSNDRYFFTNGDVKAMPERWTAVLLKEGGDWKVSRIVFSANVLDNPVLTGVKDAMQQMMLWLTLAGIIVGALGMWFFRCRKTA